MASRNRTKHNHRSSKKKVKKGWSSKRIGGRTKEEEEEEAKVAELLKLSQTIAKQVRLFDAGDDSHVDQFEAALFDFAIYDFVQGLPCCEADFYNSTWRGYNPSRRGYLTVFFDSSDEHCKLTLYAVGRNSIISSEHHAVLYKITPILLDIVALRAKDYYVELNIANFNCQNHCKSGSAKPPSIEDVFHAFGKAGHWNRKLVEMGVSYCHMNAVGDAFEFGGVYPEALEELHVCWPFNCGGIESSTIYKIASRSPRLRILATGGGGGTDMLMTDCALNSLCGILSRVNTFDAAFKQRRLSHLSDDDFHKVMEALTSGHCYPPKRLPRGANARYRLVQLYFMANQFRDLFQNRAIPKALVPLILDHCQRKAKVPDRGGDAQAKYRRNLLFYLLRERVDWIILPPTKAQKGIQ